VIAECKERVAAILRECGSPVGAGQIHLGKSALSGHITTPMVVLMAGQEESAPDGTIIDSATTGRTRVYVQRRATRAFWLAVVVVHRTEEEAAGLLECVVSGLLDGLVVDGRPVTAHRVSADWLDDEALARQEARAVASVRFDGGYYRTIAVPCMADLAICGETAGLPGGEE
jgi:hypothetical protein